MRRRSFLQLTGAALLSGACQSPGNKVTKYAQLDEILRSPVLDPGVISAPVIIESVNLLHHEGNFVVQVRSRNGAEGHAVCNNAHMRYLYPILTQKVAPFFVGKDARRLEELLNTLYITKSNYKLQGLGFWIPQASVEFAILDLLGRIAQLPVAELIGGRKRNQIAVYRANNFRGLNAVQSIEKIRANVESSGAKAIKFKIGARMRKDADDPEGRTEALVPLVRKTFGDEMVLYADANGSYSVGKATEIGRLLQDYGITFYEEPVPWDWLEETKAVADNLKIAIAGGEQETSMHRFRWLIANDALQIVQPDLFYFGGMLRSMMVARMAAAMGKVCTPHISGSGLGYVYMLQFVSALENAGPFHEFKGVNEKIPLHCDTSSLRSENGYVAIPTGPGMAIDIDPDFLAKHEVVSH